MFHPIALGLVIIMLALIIKFVGQEGDKSNRKLVTYTQLGKRGRFGNQLFQIAATLAVAKELDRDVKFPMWKYQYLFPNLPSSYFDNTLDKTFKSSLTQNDNEGGSAYKFTHIIKNPTAYILNITGYRQNYKYFKSYDHEIRRFLQFDKKKVKSVLDKLPVLKGECLGLHIRRGDYVNSEWYYVCDKGYFKRGVSYYPKTPIVIFTDDKKWCKENFSFPNSIISPFDNVIDDFIGLTMCSKKVISNSSFSWWACYLGDTKHVVAPSPWVRNSDREHSKDVYLPHWKIIKGRKGA